MSDQQRDEIETEPVSDAQLIRVPLKQSRWFTGLGFMAAPYHSSATIATNGQTLAGGTAEASTVGSYPTSSQSHPVTSGTICQTFQFSS